MPYADPERQREYQREWYARRRAEWFEGKVCVDCGSTDRLELDHVDPTQKVSHNIWSWSRARREAELAKCVVRCRDHHQIKSATECLSGLALDHSVLPVEVVADIRQRWSDGTRQVDLAAEYGVDRRHVFDLVHRRTRVHE